MRFGQGPRSGTRVLSDSFETVERVVEEARRESADQGHLGGGLQASKRTTGGGVEVLWLHLVSLKQDQNSEFAGRGATSASFCFPGAVVPAFQSGSARNIIRAL